MMNGLYQQTNVPVTGRDPEQGVFDPGARNKFSVHYLSGRDAKEWVFDPGAQKK